MSIGDRMQYPVPPALEHPELLAYRAEFPILYRKTYLNNCSQGALSQRCRQQIQQFLETWDELGAYAWQQSWLDEITRARQKFASLIGAQLHEVAIAPNVSSALSSIASALDYDDRNKVVTTDMDFPTLSYQWLVKQRLGVATYFVESSDHIYIAPEAFEAVVDNKTALVATSRVLYKSGYIQDIRSIADIAHKNGAYILLDDYQGTGQVPLNVVALDIDVLVTGTQKWLLGGPGLAFVYIREGLIPSLEPTIAGWFGHRDQFSFKTRDFEFRTDATRIEQGTPSMAAVYAANGGLDIILEASVESICERSRYLTNDLIARAKEHGWKVLAPAEPELRSSIVSLEIDDPQAIAQDLIARNIIVDAHDGVLRISPYFYNTIEENAIVIDAIEQLLEGRNKAS
ncbi:aminotransferase class V-fold PLP-dependent enzyme [Ktedonosporobacter rubrisoli]|uniref:Aminotransferase class V-fold PLP-dependent enzyme n=1 Tax=Ktedonosporobacter rubrisoli TaxID=2509675 RepID=A0A4V0YYX3_KTERU|nr:aminotransferase class V-fold PLP-dependent enzyme [Ktedonosporobacter rubrisoli]QBD77721.1 aminotransferase class V-fold PLP-dependent enzyme [Ktedonosporobacter rubrisoli]